MTSNKYGNLFTEIPNSLIEDKNLTPNARLLICGIFMYKKINLISENTNEEVNMYEVAKILGFSKFKMDRALEDLKDWEYL